VPGTSAAPPAPPSTPDAMPVITWPGFKMRPDGTSRVFVQSTVAIAPQSSAAPGKFSVVLPGAKVVAGTNRLPLETRFFNTPVTRVNIAVQRDAVTVSLDLRADVAPVVSTERGPTGYYFVYIDLPKGSFLPGSQAAGQPPTAAAAPAAASPSRAEPARPTRAESPAAPPAASRASASKDLRVEGAVKLQLR
jgi:hypothetical protein